MEILSQSERNKRSSMFWMLNISGWILLYFIYTTLYYRNDISDLKTLLALFITHLTGFFISLLLRYYYKKIDYQSRSILFLAIVIIVTSFLAANFWLWIDILLSLPLQGMECLAKWLAVQYYISSIYSHLWVLLSWSSLYFTIKLWEAWMLQKDRTERANALAQAAQLQMLRYQLNPHFLFNALNSIRALIDENRKTARRVITELSELLRYSLVSKNYSDVPLINEIDAIRHYFAIEKIRYEDNLEVTVTITPEAEDYPVLSFLIHPLAENALKFGMQTSQLPLRIWIKAAVSNGTLTIDVINSGKWIDPVSHGESQGDGAKIGLKNVQRRLENAFPDRHHFEINETKGKVRVRIEIYGDKINNQRKAEGMHLSCGKY